MVVLDTNYGTGMLSNTNYEDRYLTPDPITIPPTLDAKNSPLALLAQTCSQIGADSSNAKPLLSSLERKKSSSANSTASSTERSPSSGIVAAAVVNGVSKSRSDNKSPEGARLAFKPYELNVLTRKSDSAVVAARSPSANNGAITANPITLVTATAAAVEHDDRKSTSRTSSRKSASASPHAAATPNEKCSLSSPSSATSSTVNGGDAKSHTPVDANTITKSSPSNDLYASLKAPFSALNSLNGFGCNGCPTLPPGFDPTNPAFRNSFAANGAAAAHLPHPASLLDAAACFQSSAAVPSPYMYTRVKTPTGTEAVVPVCKDPFCFGCRFTLHGTMGPCPPGCVQCDQKYNAAAAAAMLMSPFGGAAAAAAGAYQYGRPLVCSWMSSGEQYCGKRFRSSEELLQHLRTHTNTGDPVALMNHLRYSSAAAAAAAAAAINPLAAASSAAAARYHPYAKPGALPPSLATSPFSAFNPTLSPYYSPYSLYDQRIGAAVNP